MTFTGYDVVKGYPQSRFSTSEPLGAIEREHEVQVRIFSNDDQDETVGAYEYIVANIAALNSTYAFGNGFDNDAYLYHIDPKRVANSRPDAPQFLATLRWKTFSNDDQKEDKDGEDGEKTDDPTQWKTQVRTAIRKVEEEVRNARYIEGYNGSADTLLTDYEGPVVNSTLQPFDPPATRVRSLRTYEITAYHSTYFGPSDDAYLDRTNSDTLEFTMPDDTLVTLQPYTALCEDIVWDWVEINEREVWRRTVVLVVDPLKWRKEYLDRGAFARALDGDPDGLGGTYSAADRPADAPTVRRLLDENDQPVIVKLDGDGSPLAEGSDPVYGKWAVIEETELGGLVLS